MREKYSNKICVRILDTIVSNFGSVILIFVYVFRIGKDVSNSPRLWKYPSYHLYLFEPQVRYETPCQSLSTRVAKVEGWAFPTGPCCSRRLFSKYPPQQVARCVWAIFQTPHIARRFKLITFLKTFVKLGSSKTCPN